MEPWGPERADLNAGIIAATIANCHRDSRRRREPFTPRDFMPRFNEVEPAPKREGNGLNPARVRSLMEGLMRHQARLDRAGRL